MKGRSAFYRKWFKQHWSTILFGLLVLLLVFPQTRMPLQVAINRAKMVFWSPSIETVEEGPQIPPFDYVTQDLQGTKVVHRIGDGRVTFISQWATWCPPCVAELPSIAELHRTYGDAVDFVLVTQERPEVVLQFLERKGMALPVYLPLMPLPEKLQTNRLPTSYLIDSKGNIRVSETGAADWNSDAVRALLSNLILERK